MVLRTELLAALSEGEAKAIKFDMLELQLSNLKEELMSSNALLQDSIPRSEFVCFQTNIAVLFQEFTEFVSSFRQEAKLLMTDSISRIDEMLSDPEICRPAILDIIGQGRHHVRPHLGSAPASNDDLNPSNHQFDENALSEEDVDVLSVVHPSRNQRHCKLGSAPPPSNDDQNSSVYQYDENSMSEENLDVSSNVSTGESVTAQMPD
jgi:hypothetical protein